jgi:hypothetical protein
VQPSPLISTGRGRRGQNAQFIIPLPSPAGGDGAAAAFAAAAGGLYDPGATHVAVGGSGGMFSPSAMAAALQHATTPRIGGVSQDGTAVSVACIYGEH